MYVHVLWTVRWDFEDGTNGWAQSTPLEMGLDVDAINGQLRGVVLPSATFGAAFVDSPELRVEVQEAERDVLVFRMKYLGQCDTGMVALERNAREPSVDPGARRERTQLHDPVQIPFHVRANALDSELYYLPIWRHVTGTVHRVRFYPCVVLPKATAGSALAASRFGQSFQLDWVAFAKGRARASGDC